MSKALNRLKTSEHCGVSSFSMSCVPHNLSFLFLSFCKFVVENEVRSFGNDKCDVNTGHVSSPAVTICSHFFLCCVCLSLYLHNSTWWFMLRIFRSHCLATRLTPWNGLPWPSYLPYPLTAMSHSYLFTELSHNLRLQDISFHILLY